jgi:hypothetical protein
MTGVLQARCDDQANARLLLEEPPAAASIRAKSDGYHFKTYAGWAADAAFAGNSTTRMLVYDVGYRFDLDREGSAIKVTLIYWISLLKNVSVHWPRATEGDEIRPETEETFRFGPKRSVALKSSTL